jgi:hypothetical protein
MNAKLSTSILTLALFSSPAFGQTIHKCPSTTPGAPPVIQQMPCSPQGGGEMMEVKPLKSSGEGLRPEETAVSKQLSEHNRAAEQTRADIRAKGIEEDKRQEALNIERRKARALEEQAAAMRALRYRY